MDSNYSCERTYEILELTADEINPGLTIAVLKTWENGGQGDVFINGKRIGGVLDFDNTSIEKLIEDALHEYFKEQWR